jgi:H+/gluconate symporter-like permease
MWAVYKGLNSVVACTIAAIIVCFVSGLPVVETMTGTFVNGMTFIFSMMFLKFLAANLFGQIYTMSGAALSVAHFFRRIFVQNATGFKKKLITVYMFMGIAILFGFGGLETFVCIFTLLPIGMALFRDADIPRRLLPATLMAGISAAVCCPGTPLTNGNILAGVFFRGTPTTAGLIPGLIGVIVVLVLDGIYLYKAVKKADAAGVHFDIGDSKLREDSGERKLPNAGLALIPLLVIAVMTMIFQITLEVALLSGILLACILFAGNISNRKQLLKPYVNIADSGAMQASLVIIFMVVQMGLATVIQSTQAFAFVSGIFADMPTHPLVRFASAASLTGFLAGNAITGIQFSADIFLPLAETLGLSANAMHRISCFAVSILDTVPINGAVISSLVTCGLSHKEGYFPIFMTTLLNIFVGLVVVVLMLMAFPALA